MDPYLKSLNWRYATKKFDDKKKVSQEDLDTLVHAMQLSVSSYGLQPYHVFIISDAALREQLKSVSWGQSQITDASHLIVFANKTAVDDELIDSYLDKVSETRGIPKDGLSGYGDFMKSKLLPLDDGTKAGWTARQTYIALGNLLSAAASLQIDACPMEGFEPEAYNEILGLKEKGLNAAVVATIGYRSEADETQHYKKVRRSKKELFTHL
ncbi:NAD(P)H-dependent oxidoreductase [Flavobacteriaceae bacterium 3-367]|uniref:NAD(P)H-dependent oxidoreductase n=1 Tax=Eudoraea algarum TaxID=3417568 RepID=UPI003295B9CD